MSSTQQIEAKKAMDNQRRHDDKAIHLHELNSNAFPLLLDQQPDPLPPPPPKKKKRALRSKHTVHSSSQQVSEPTTIIKRRRQYSPTDDEDPVNDDRTLDIQERDAFAQRLKEKDTERQNKLIEDRNRLSHTIQKRRAIAEDPIARVQALPNLRERSRQSYLEKREEQQLLIMKRQIEEERMLFRNDKLTQKEVRDLDYRERLVKIAEERRAIESESKIQVYSMPEEYHAKEDLALKRSKEAVSDHADQHKFSTEQDEWERHQLKAAKLGVVDLNTLPDASNSNEFDFVFDEAEHVQFVLNNTINNEHTVHTPVIDSAVEKAMSMKQVRDSLPIYQYRDILLDALKEHQIIIIVGETGSGKTTQIPQYLHEAGFTDNNKKIGCTQPRRVAAMSVAARVAEEMDVKLGYEVGYSIRFEDCTGDKTVIKYMTDGILLREFMTEPDLASYSCLIIDEAHERTLHTDVLLALIKDIARFRKDLKLLISSATMDAQKFSDYFDYAPILYVEGRKFPVDIYYTKSPEADYVQACIATVMQIHITQGPGDILVFLTGQEEIEAAQEQLTLITKSLGKRIKELIISPIYSSLPSDMQAKIFDATPIGARKVVLATNIAETSITINGITYVIDPGFVKQTSYNPRTGMESLIVTPASRAAVNQRAGRAGRVGPGKCFRLYTLWAYENELEADTIPEIQRTNLGSTVLMLKSLGINDLIDFDFMDAPPAETLIRALEQLYALGALNDQGVLTKLGRRMAEFPADPMLSRTLLAAEQFSCSEEIVSIVAMLSVQNSLFYKPKDKAVHADLARQAFNHPSGDHMTMLKVWTEWVETQYSIQWCYEHFVQHRAMNRARDVRDQLVALLDRVEVGLNGAPDPFVDPSPILKSFTAGFFYHACRLNKSGESYRNVKHLNSVYIHPTSALYVPHKSKRSTGPAPKWVVYHELVLTSKEYMRQCSILNPQWLLEVAPHYYAAKDLEDGSAGTSKRKMPLQR